MKNIRSTATTVAALSLSALIHAQSVMQIADADDPKKSLGIVTITATAPSSLPSEIPTTMQGISGEKIAQTVNATDSEDALKYFPSLLVRKRYIGDYNHAVLSSRASGTGNSARSAVYADGILLSNYLGNGAAYTPRWALVTPEEVERVDVMYGPFSAAYPGNSAGAVVDFVTRMPERFEAHAKAIVSTQPSRLYSSDDTFNAHQESLSVGSRSGVWSWWASFNHTDSHGQPLTFPTRLVSAGTISTAGTPVTGAVLDRDRSNNPWYLLGTATEYRTLQEHARIKLAYDISPTLRASYTLGLWQNSATNRPASWLRDASGNPVYSGAVNIGGRFFSLTAADYSLSDETFRHFAHGLSVKSHVGGQWDWEVAASLYAFSTDLQRQATVALPTAASGGAGTVTDQSGTGWNTLALKGIWRPSGADGAHVFDFGLQQERYQLRALKSNITGDWRYDPAGSLNTNVGGNSSMQSLYAQDAWTLAKDWKTVLGLRVEKWTAFGGYTATGSSAANYDSRNTTYVSPKAALSWQVGVNTVLKTSVGRAVRMPTVNELYGATSGVLTVVNDPNLRPEKSWTGELSLERELPGLQLRATVFYESVRDSLYSERTAVGSASVTRISNVGRIATPGVELALQGFDWLLPGLDLQASLTWADSRIRENSGYVTTPGDTLGKYQPRVPEWRATAQAGYRIDDRWTASLAVRFSGTQYSTLDNSDPNGYAYQGASPYISGDLRLRYQPARRWHVAVGVDNAGNYQYWNFHPYPDRTYIGEVQFDW
jgi:iron complex outermembrane receptor protein